MPESVLIETITPKKAKKWLDESNYDNRNLRPSRVEAYARDIQNKKWSVTTGAIGFDTNGMLVDGQHRLAACVEAGSPFKSLVMRGMDPNSRRNIDTGATRNFSDLLKFMGLGRNVAQLSASIRWCVNYERGALLNRKPITHAELLEWFERNPTIDDWASYMKSHKAPTSIATEMSGIALFTEDRLPGEAMAFNQQVYKGEDLHSGMPAFALRRALVNDAILAKKMKPVIRQALVIKAFNAFVLGERVDRLYARLGGIKPEPFPTIVTDYQGSEL